ncbi:MAG TPA: CvpA family protein [Candidatus Dormibacteraeota bacterium]
MFIDIAIGVLILVALILGYQRGVIQPLMAEIFFFGTLLLVFRFHDQYTSLLEKTVHLNSVFGIFIALILAIILGAVGGAIGGAFHRMESIRGIDGLLGVFVHVIVMLVFIYLAVSALVTLDNAFVPTVNQASLTLAQVNQFENQILSNPITSALVSKDDLAALKKSAASSSGASITSINGIKQLDQIYTNFLEPQLHGSHIVPYILSIGQHLPLIGHVGPGDLKAVPTPSPNPCPTPSPSHSPSPSRTPSPKVTPKASPSPSPKPCASPSPTK